MRNLIAILMMLVGLLALIVPECPNAIIGIASAQISNIRTPSEASIVSASFSKNTHGNSCHHQECDNCGDPNHICHQYHFGHSGFPTNQFRLSSFEVAHQYGHPSEQLIMDALISSLFRPPIS